MWIAFKSSIFTMIYNGKGKRVQIQAVVNCFQKFYFYDDLQPLTGITQFLFRCELLSKVLFLRWFTTRNYFFECSSMLWIAFKSSIFTMIYNPCKFLNQVYVVVNCFQKFYFYDDLQLQGVISIPVLSCELLSKVLFLRWFTTPDVAPNALI